MLMGFTSLQNVTGRKKLCECFLTKCPEGSVDEDGEIVLLSPWEIK